jgi:flagellin FlaB
VEAKEMQKLSWKKREKDEVGEMGVGTLLIFIAMILVAAVAAGVLVQTAYKLQSQAELTGDQAMQEISTGVKIVAAWGVSTGTVISELHMKIALQAGSPQINLDNMVIEISDGATEVSLAYEGDVSATGFNATQIRDTYPTNTWTTTDVGVTPGDLVEIVVSLNLTAQELVTQQGMSVLLIPKHGVPTYFAFVAPSVFATDIITLK